MKKQLKRGKTYPRYIGNDFMSLGEYDISYEDFCCLIHYFLTNTDLEKDDPRLVLMKRIKSMKKVNYPALKRRGLSLALRQ